jgi:Na+/melibiose symporter-like transporter
VSDRDASPVPARAEPSVATLLAYALPALPLAVLTLPFFVIVPEFYARVGGVPIAAVGIALLMVRLVDAVSDPLAGLLADATRLRFGRRRIWLLASGPLVAVTAWFVFVPPDAPSALYLALWGAALSLAWTAAQVPWQAWGAELSGTYHGRTRVAAFRESLTVTGTLLALVLPALLPALGHAGDRAPLIAFALIVGIGFPLATLVTIACVPEPVAPAPIRARWRDDLPELARNRAFTSLIGAFFINGIANGLPGSLFLFFVGERLLAPDMAGPLLVLYFVAGVAGVPIWLVLAKRIGKARAWIAGMGLASATFIFAATLGPGDVTAFAIVCLLSGLALGADIVLPASIQADIIEADRQATGKARAASFLGFWALATKLAFAAAVGIAFPVLGAMGFDPGAGLRTEAGLLTLSLLYAAVPVALKLVAIALMLRFARRHDPQGARFDQPVAHATSGK